MAIGDISILDTLKWSDDSDGSATIEVRDGIIAEFFQVSATPKCATFSYDGSGNLTKLDEETLTGITDCSDIFSAIKIADGIGAFVYQDQSDASASFRVATVSIDAGGNITAAVLDTMEMVDPANGGNIVHAIGDFWVVSYDIGGNPYIATVDIDSSGTIAATITASQQLSAAGSCNTCQSIKIATGIVAIFYDVDNQAYVETRSISAAGAISAVIDGPDSWGLGAHLHSVFPFHMSGTIYACSYEDGTSRDGWLNTFNIADNGTITEVDIDTFEFETVGVGTSQNPQGAWGNSIAIIWYGENSTGDGLAITIDVDTSGNIGASILDTEIVDAGYAYVTNIIKISNTMYIVSWADNDSYGQAASISIVVGKAYSQAHIIG